MPAEARCELWRRESCSSVKTGDVVEAEKRKKADRHGSENGVAGERDQEVARRTETKVTYHCCRGSAPNGCGAALLVVEGAYKGEDYI